MVLPLSDSGVVSSIYKNCEDVEALYGDSNITVHALVDCKRAGQLKKYIENYNEIFGSNEV